MVFFFYANHQSSAIYPLTMFFNKINLKAKFNDFFNTLFFNFIVLEEKKT